VALVAQGEEAPASKDAASTSGVSLLAASCQTTPLGSRRGDRAVLGNTSLARCYLRCSPAGTGGVLSALALTRRGVVVLQFNSNYAEPREERDGTILAGQK
jgi:hypothetical protein